MVSQYMYTYNK